MPDHPVIDRFEANADLVARLFADLPEARLREERVPGKWSAHDNLAHLAQFHDVIEGRLDATLAQDNPVFSRFSPDADPRTDEWRAKSSADVIEGFRERRRALCARLRALAPDEWARVGTHAAFGTMDVGQWLEFYLQHEGHHLYTAIVRART